MYDTSLSRACARRHLQYEIQNCALMCITAMHSIILLQLAEMLYSYLVTLLPIKIFFNTTE